MKKPRLHAIGNEQVVVTIVVDIGRADAGGTVTNHRKPQLLLDEPGVVLILEIDARVLRHIIKVGLVARVALPFNQGSRGNFEVLSAWPERHGNITTIDQRTRSALGRSDHLEPNARPEVF